LARAAGCSASTISAAEQGKRPAPETLASICDILGISLDDVFKPTRARVVVR
jgi:transcriptional regulator with XRE-family HTH domain